MKPGVTPRASNWSISNTGDKLPAIARVVLESEEDGTPSLSWLVDPMTNLTRSTTEITTVTTGIVQSWVNTPMVVALLFGLAGGFFIAILVLRRRK